MSVLLLLLFRVFGLYEENVQFDPEREHFKTTVLQEYKQKLKIQENIIPGQTDLKSGWINEKNGMKNWNGQDYIFLTLAGFIVWFLARTI